MPEQKRWTSKQTKAEHIRAAGAHLIDRQTPKKKKTKSYIESFIESHAVLNRLLARTSAFVVGWPY